MIEQANSREHLLLSQSEQARDAVESLFRPHLAASNDSADVPVVFKRRRSSLGADPTGDDDGADRATSARPPRVFRLEKRQEPYEQQDDGLSSVDAPERASQSDESTSNSERTRGQRRRARRLHGDVNIIRPVAEKAQPPARENYTLEIARIGDARVPSAANGRFGNDKRLLQRYEQLMTKIARLEQQAHAAREKEKCDAVRWIREAMHKHGIGVRELVS